MRNFFPPTLLNFFANFYFEKSWEMSLKLFFESLVVGQLGLKITKVWQGFEPRSLKYCGKVQCMIMDIRSHQQAGDHCGQVLGIKSWPKIGEKGGFILKSDIFQKGQKVNKYLGHIQYDQIWWNFATSRGMSIVFGYILSNDLAKFWSTLATMLQCC